MTVGKPSGGGGVSGEHARPKRGAACSPGQPSCRECGATVAAPLAAARPYDPDPRSVHHVGTLPPQAPAVRGTAWQPPPITAGVSANADPASLSTPISPGGIEGTVRGLREHADEHGQILTFLVERHDEEGRSSLTVPVEIRGLRLHGVLRDGDAVMIRGRWHPGQTLRPRRVRNVTTGGEVRARGSYTRRVVLTLAAFIIIAAAMVTAFLTLVSQHRPTSPQRIQTPAIRQP